MVSGDQLAFGLDVGQSSSRRSASAASASKTSPAASRSVRCPRVVCEQWAQARMQSVDELDPHRAFVAAKRCRDGGLGVAGVVGVVVHRVSPSRSNRGTRRSESPPAPPGRGPLSWGVPAHAGGAEKAEARAAPAGEPGGAEQSERVPDSEREGDLGRRGPGRHRRDGCPQAPDG